MERKKRAFGGKKEIAMWERKSVVGFDVTTNKKEIHNKEGRKEKRNH